MTHDENGLGRRRVGAGLLSGSLMAAAAHRASAQPAPPADPEAEHRANMPRRPDAGPPIKVAMLVYPRMIMMDLVNPQTILKILGAEIHLVGETKVPMSTDIDVPVMPTTTFAECPQELDVLFVPGGLMGSIACMSNLPLLKFLADRGRTARYVTSVCTGGLVLAAAGLLRGYRATAHWGVADLLPLMGAIRSHDRVVQDRNRLTGAGATAGLDFGLTLAALLRDQRTAERIQLILEYAPQPPFHAGTPEEVGPERLNLARSQRTWMDGRAHEAALAAARRLGI